MASTEIWSWTLTRSQVQLLLVLVPNMLYFYSNFFSRPIVNQLLLEVVCDNSGETNCEDSATISGDTALLAMYGQIVGTVPALVLSGFYGQLADRVGRRFVMCLAIFGYMQFFGAMAVIAATRTSYYKELYLASSFIAGSLGGFNSFNLAVYSYANDITADMPEQRGMYFTVLDAGHSISKLLAPVSSGVWVDSQGFALPLGFSSACCLAALLWVALALSDTRHRTEEDGKGKSGGGSGGSSLQLDILTTYRNIRFVPFVAAAQTGADVKRGSKEEEGTEAGDEGTGDAGGAVPQHGTKLAYAYDLPVQLNTFFIFFVAYFMERDIYVLYFKKAMKLDATEIGAIDSYQGLMTTASMLLMPGIVTLLGIGGGVLTDQLYVLVGVFARLLYYIALALLPSSAENVAWPRLLGISSVLLLTGPALPRSRSVATNCVPQGHQASVQASFSALQALALLLSILGNLLYAATVAHTITAVWWLCVALMASATILCAWQYVAFVLPSRAAAAGEGLSKPLLALNDEEE